MRADRLLNVARALRERFQRFQIAITRHEPGEQWHQTSEDTAFALPFGTIRACRVCGCLVAGGPTACVRCAKETG